MNYFRTCVVPDFHAKFFYLVEHLKDEDEQLLRDWTYHHKLLNKLAPLEDQMDWLREAGFRQVDVVFQKFQTALVYARK